MTQLVKPVLQKPEDVSAFIEAKFDAFWKERGDWVEAKEWTFHELNSVEGATPQIERVRHARLVDLAFTLGGRKGADMIRRIPDTSETKAFETTFGNGESFYQLAVSQGDSHLLDALVERITVVGDVDEDFINNQDKHGRTALHVLAQHSTNAGMGVKMSLHERQEAARSLIVDARIDTSVKDEQGQSASSYLESVVERNRALINNPQAREVWENDNYLNAIVDDAASMRQAISQIKLKGALGQTQERSGTIDESRSADVIDMDDFRRRRAQGDDGPER